ncbi:Dabb family protein [Aliiroseovarius marinus]|uniref:Dabb family protein n=1 Tax=Aliiroseovarius marinus TaxID=2500159 RepID=UPI00105D4D88|nr:Dabb family protein [Aliiroseovarius marinus]
MIIHCVFCQFRSDADPAETAEVLRDLAELCTDLPGVLSFEHGPNRDFEQKSQAFNAGFVIRFADQSALQHYADHPKHQALGQRLCQLCVGGADGIIVFDLEC